MKRAQSYLLSFLIALAIMGCGSAETPQATPQLTKQFGGSPMPADIRKKFQESMSKNHAPEKQGTTTGGGQ